MAVHRAVAAAAVVVAFLVTASPLSAGSLDTCAQRVIRDWYAGGRVDGVYPLPCYRAAIKALPSDVLQYSDADRDIASALAYARQKHRAAATRAEERAAQAHREQARADAASPAPAKPSYPNPKREPASPVGTPPRSVDEPVRLASGDTSTAVESSVPYPVIALGALAGVLLLSGAAGWLTRRRRPGTTPDR
jgi:hypothetical protein